MCLNIRIQNIVSAGSHGHKIFIPEIYKKYQLLSTYDPELFPGIRIVIQPPNATDVQGKQLSLRALVFTSGNCVLTGAKTREEITSGWSVVQSVVRPFLDLESTISTDNDELDIEELHGEQSK